MRARLTTAVAALLLLTGCASAAPVTELGPAPADAPDPAVQVEALTTALTEVYAHFLDASQTPTEIVSDDATVDVAVAELAQALPLGDGARRFLTATAFELGRSQPDGDVTAVTMTPEAPRVVGSHDGEAVATVQMTQQTLRSSGPTTEENVTYALVLDGDSLADVRAWSGGLDSGVGLGSPTGAVLRFLQLVRADDLEAAQFFSGGVNTETQLQVLRTLTGGRVSLLELPQARMGSAHLVYALDEAGRVVGRFEVLIGQETSVVYSPTS